MSLISSLLEALKDTQDALEKLSKLEDVFVAQIRSVEAANNSEVPEWKTQQRYPFFLTLESYQTQAKKFQTYPRAGANLYYPALGLGGESGETLEKIKKLMRDDGGQLSQEKRDALEKELGDVLWYVSALCDELGLELAEVAMRNLQKLTSRKERGELHGSGDNR